MAKAPSTQISARATSFRNQPGKKPRPLLKAALNLANEISEETETSNIQMMNGSSTNRMAPLARCRIDTTPANGKRYCSASVKRIGPGLAFAVSAIPNLVLCVRETEAQPQDFIATQQCRTPGLDCPR